MDGKRFDELSKVVAKISSRRQVVRGLVAGAAGGVVGLIGHRSADAKTRKRGRNEICRKPGDCADGLSCVDASNGRQRCCPAESTICNGKCCDTLCTEEFGCADSVTDAMCYFGCVDALCFHMNNGFNQYWNYSFNSELDCELFCAYRACSNIPG